MPHVNIIYHIDWHVYYIPWSDALMWYCATLDGTGAPVSLRPTGHFLVFNSLPSPKHPSLFLQANLSYCTVTPNQREPYVSLILLYCKPFSPHSCLEATLVKVLWDGGHGSCIFTFKKAWTSVLLEAPLNKVKVLSFAT